MAISSAPITLEALITSAATAQDQFNDGNFDEAFQICRWLLRQPAFTSKAGLGGVHLTLAQNNNLPVNERIAHAIRAVYMARNMHDDLPAAAGSSQKLGPQLAVLLDIIQREQTKCIADAEGILDDLRKGKPTRKLTTQTTDADMRQLVTLKRSWAKSIAGGDFSAFTRAIKDMTTASDVDILSHR